MSIIQGTSKAAGGGYEIDQSCRFNDGDTPELSRTYTLSAPWTFSAWVKRGEITSENLILGATAGEIHFNANDTLEAETTSSTALFRDPSAWYHIHVSDGGMYVNGVSHGAVTTTALTNTKLFDDFDGYAAEVHLQTGTSAYTNFGESNTDGVWIPKSATAGDTYLKFANSADFGTNSGTGGAWTATNLATTDQMLDTPTLNYCTWNVLANYSGLGGLSGSPTFSDGSLKAVSGATYQTATGTLSIKEGLFYWEVTVSALTTYVAVGIANPGYLGTGNYRRYYDYTGNKGSNGAAGTGYGATYTAGDVIGIALDMTTGDIEFFKNNSSQGVAFTDVTSALPDDGWTPFIVLNAATVVLDCGQSGFAYTPPTGFNALNTANLATPSITDGSAHFQPTLYTGTGSSLAVTQSGNSTFQPDLVWIKGRSGATEHVLTDTVRGVTKELSSNDTGAEETVAQGLTTFGSAGFTVGTDGSYNTSSATYVGWQWKANGSGSSNTDGSITSTASANTTAGFSVSTYTGTGSAATIGHGLGIAPKMIIVKKRVAGTDDAWIVWHASLPGANYYLNLNDTGAQDTSVNYWNNTLPTSAVFSVGASNGTNENTKTFVAYCFAEIPGYSSFGSYTGNGSADGPFVYTGMTPEFVIIKRSNTTENWIMLDNARSVYNPTNDVQYPNLAQTDNTNSTSTLVDNISNGFKVRGTNTNINASGSTYIYMAFAENPFGGDGVAPATAR